MGRGKHTTHKEDVVQMSVKIPKSIYKKITNSGFNSISDASYLRELIYDNLYFNKILVNEQ